MHHYHLLQTVVCRSIGRGRGQYLHKCVGRGSHYRSVHLTGVGLVDLQLLISRIIDDECLAVEAVHRCVSIDCQLFLHPEFLTAVGIEGIGLDQLVELRLILGCCSGCQYRRQDERGGHQYFC